jgi:mannose-6-phosphate isomerase
MDAPLRFVPYLRPMVWGGRRLEIDLAKHLEAAGPFGESWEISDHPSHVTKVADGPLRGLSLRDLMESDRPGLLGHQANRFPRFPWLIKFLDACDWLSVQVHPDDQRVQELWPGEGGKTEAWYILDAVPGSRIFSGLLPGVDEGGLRKALSAGTVAECLHQFEPYAGQSLFLPAGTVHAVGGGVLMAEIQQTSDATFRLFDWNRRDAQGQGRTLHVEQSLACIDWKRGPVVPIETNTPSNAKSSHRKQTLVRCPYFDLDFVQSDEPLPLAGTGRMQVMIATSGNGQLETKLGKESVRRGDVVLFPASLPMLWCKPDSSLSLLIVTLPG